MLSPSRAAVIAASQPAWPPPTTITSKCSLKGVVPGWLDGLETAMVSILHGAGCPGAVQVAPWKSYQALSS